MASAAAVAAAGAERTAAAAAAAVGGERGRRRGRSGRDIPWELEAEAARGEGAKTAVIGWWDGRSRRCLASAARGILGASVCARVREETWLARQRSGGRGSGGGGGV